MAASRSIKSAQRVGFLVKNSPQDALAAAAAVSPGKLAHLHVIINSSTSTSTSKMTSNMMTKREARSCCGNMSLLWLQVALIVCSILAPTDAGPNDHRLLRVISDDLEPPSAASAAFAALTSLSAGSGERPRLIPLVAAESGYSENSSVNILCTVSQGHHDSLQFDWFKDGQLLSGEQQQQLDNNHLMTSQSQNLNLKTPQIEKHSDHSLLRISRVHYQHSGRYTCAAKSQFGQDSSSVNLIVNVKLQWIKEPPKEVVVSLNQELKVDCLAQGEPKPSMRWEKLDSSQTTFAQQQPLAPSSSSSSPPLPSTSAQPRNGRMHFLGQSASHIDATAKGQLASSNAPSGHKFGQQQHQHPPTANLVVSSSRYLNIQRAREADAGFYECVAGNSYDADLRKLVHVQVRGPPKILPIATADSYPEGSSINLICTVSGGQRRGLSLTWTVNGDEMTDDSAQLLGNVAINQDDGDISIFKIKNATLKNSGQYTCTAKNPLGQDSTSVKININVEMKWLKTPKDQVEAGLNQEVQLECDATGSPQPTVQWFKHTTGGADDKPAGPNGTILLARSKQLRLARVQNKDSGLYECLAHNGVDADLRKIIQVKVRGK